jgi:hypothetical protein
MRTDQVIEQPTTTERALAVLAVAFLIASVVFFNLTLPR